MNQVVIKDPNVKKLFFKLRENAIELNNIRIELNRNDINKIDKNKLYDKYFQLIDENIKLGGEYGKLLEPILKITLKPPHISFTDNSKVSEVLEEKVYWPKFIININISDRFWIKLPMPNSEIITISFQ